MEAADNQKKPKTQFTFSPRWSAWHTPPKLKSPAWQTRPKV